MRILPGLILAVLSLNAQDARGLLSGRVLDPSGAAVAGAAVEVLQPDRGIRIEANANSQGHFELPYLSPATYTLRASAPGFKHYERTGVDVRAGDRLSVDILLQIGQATETVSVPASVGLVQTETASLGQVVDGKRILDLPLPGGSAMSLARLVPGVVSLAVSNHPTLGPAVEVASNIAINGARVGSVEFTVDGAPSMWGTNSAYAPPTDLVAEFKVSTAAYDASSGRAPGGNVNLSLRSGTNALHGAFYDFHTNNKIQGMDLFQRQFLFNPTTGPVNDAKRRTANPTIVQNRYGSTLSGPVRIPGLYNGANRTFWIFSFEGLHRHGIVRGNSQFTVPEVAQRRGDFSGLLRVGAIYQIYDPATITRTPEGRFARQPVPGNVIPDSRIDPAARRLLDYWPLPNASGTADGRNNFIRLPNELNIFRTYTGKVDHNFSPKHRAFFRYNHWFNLYQSGQVLPTDATGNNRYRYNTGAGFDDVYVVNPNFLVNLRYSFSRFEQSFYPLAVGFDVTAAGFSPGLSALIPESARTFPQINVQGIQTLGNSFVTKAFTNYHTGLADFTRIIGGHSIRFGVEHRVYREHNYNFSFSSPGLDFSTDWTRGPLDTSPVAPIGLGMASFLLGIPTGGRLDVNDSLAEQSTTTAAYIQDDWKVTRRLTLNLGIRYDYDGPVTERFNRSVRGFDFAAASPIEAQARAAYATSPVPEVPVSQFRVRGGLTFAGVNQPRQLWRGDRNNFAPRIGFAFAATPRMVFRGGYGVFIVPVGADRTSVNQSGYNIRNNLVASLDNGLSFAASLRNPFPTGIAYPPGASGGLTTDIGRSISFFTDPVRNGYMQRYSFSVEREFGWRSVGEISYVGNRGTGLGVSRPYNPVPNQYLSQSPVRDQTAINNLNQQVQNPFFPLPGTDLAARTVAKSQLLRPYPQYSGLSAQEQIGYSWYHSLQARLERRFASGFTANVNYTWSKFMEAMNFLNGGDAFLEEVISDLDRTHRITATGVWELPVGKGKRWQMGGSRVAGGILGGWQIQGVWQHNPGPPLGFGNSILIADPRAIGLAGSERRVGRWFNTDAFNRSPAQQLAQNVRTLSSRFSGVRGPSLSTWDLSAIKNFTLREPLKLQFRWEMLNAFNRTGLGAPNTDPVNTLFGSITSSAGFPRWIHVGLKLTF
ncbi:MAG: TonB-dependent receptor [Acidobacteria bacterium]|nr:TonB-dependent receptor [Acidobacteriota bacterium]